MGGDAPCSGTPPAGDIEMPSAGLQVEWFYITFHKTDRAEYVCSGRKLCEETLQTLAEYFELIYETRMNDGYYRRMQVEKVRFDAKRKMRHELEQHYACKLKHFASERRPEKPYAMQGRGNDSTAAMSTDVARSTTAIATTTTSATTCASTSATTSAATARRTPPGAKGV